MSRRDAFDICLYVNISPLAGAGGGPNSITSSTPHHLNAFIDNQVKFFPVRQAYRDEFFPDDDPVPAYRIDLAEGNDIGTMQPEELTSRQLFLNGRH